MSHNDFLPFETHLDFDQSLKILQDATLGADDGELFLERRASEVFSFEDQRLKHTSYDSSEGFGLRAVSGETTGYAHSTQMNAQALARAAQTARLAVTGAAPTLAAAPSEVKRRYYEKGNPLGDAEFAVKLEVLKEIDAFARELDGRVRQVSATLSASHQQVVILRPDGTLVSDDRPMVRLNISVTLEENGRRETGTSGAGGRHAMGGLLQPSHWQAGVKEALRIAEVNLQAVPAPAGVMDIVLGSGWPGILLHEAIGHGLEGDYNRKGTSAFAGLMGQKIASSGVTVVDDGTLQDRRGSISVDDEGTPSQCTTLIEDGVLVGYMQDRLNGRLMGKGSTGNGRRESFAHAPMPRMTNTYMLGGRDKRSDMVASLKDGLYAVGFGGGQVDTTSGKFVFSCTEAYQVKNGVIGAPVKGATLIGDGATALRNIRAIGDDMALDPGLGNCGKSGQWVPVGVGQPSLMIGGWTIGGSQV